MNDYGTNSSEVEAILKRCKSITATDAWELITAVNEAWGSLRYDAWSNGREIAEKAGRTAFLTTGQVVAETTILEAIGQEYADEIYEQLGEHGFDAIWAVSAVILALVIQDLIPKDMFRILSSPWKSVMEVEA